MLILRPPPHTHKPDKKEEDIYEGRPPREPTDCLWDRDECYEEKEEADQENTDINTFHH